MDTQKYQICEMHESDAQDLVNFFNESAGESPFMSYDENESGKTIEGEREQIKKWKEINAIALGVRDISNGNALVAFGAALAIGRRSHHVHEYGIIVRKRVWRQGIGRALMIEMMERSKKAGAYKFFLKLNAENHGALKLYESLGFQVEALLKDQLKFGNKLVDLIAMGRKANP